MRYSLRNLRRAIRNPSLVLGEINKYLLKANKAYHDRFAQREGTFVMEADWDNLLILDGCRYDVFAERNDIDGDLSRRISRGSQSWEFMRENFQGRQFHDTVYVSANPYTSKLNKGTFHHVVNLYEDHWDDGFETVLPEDVVKQTLTTQDAHPDKRLIVHFMQPHFPFIGETGRQLNHTGIDHERFDDANKEGRYPIWSNLRYGFTDITTDEVWEAYVENLDIVLDHVERLLASLPGQSVVTADHGNLIGERLSPIAIRGYGHPDEIRVPELVEVPWLVINSSERRDVTAEAPVTSEEVQDETVDERLRDLGYL